MGIIVDWSVISPQNQFGLCTVWPLTVDSASMKSKSPIDVDRRVMKPPDLGSIPNTSTKLFFVVFKYHGAHRCALCIFKPFNWFAIYEI